MKLLLPLLIVLALPLVARGHIGSPNVFFVGPAGPHAVRVIIRPPGALPGLAEVDVRIETGEAAAVTVQPRFRQADAPAPVAAQRVNGDGQQFHAAVWLLRSGMYSVEITVEGAAGNGVVRVPLQAAAFLRPELPRGLGLGLVLLGVSLGAGAVWIAVGCVPARPWRAGGVAVLLVASTVNYGAARWRTMDREFRDRALARPRAVEARIREAGPLRLLRLTRPSAENAGVNWDALVTDHGKLMHLFLCSEPAGAVFAHLHPVRRDARTFERAAAAARGNYRLYAEITGETGTSETLATEIALPVPAGPALPPRADWKMVNEVWCRAPGVPVENAAEPFALDADDAWHMAPAPERTATRTQVSALADGSRMIFHDVDDLIQNRPATLRFSVFTAAGHRAVLQPYMGMPGHAVVRRADGAVFVHLHSSGTISMAAQELLQPSATAPSSLDTTGGMPAGEVTFPYAFPQPGEYRVWTQVRLAGQVVTGDFTVQVQPAR